MSTPLQRYVAANPERTRLIQAAAASLVSEGKEVTFANMVAALEVHPGFELDGALDPWQAIINLELGVTDLPPTPDPKSVPPRSSQWTAMSSGPVLRRAHSEVAERVHAQRREIQRPRWCVRRRAVGEGHVVEFPLAARDRLSDQLPRRAGDGWRR